MLEGEWWCRAARWPGDFCAAVGHRPPPRDLARRRPLPRQPLPKDAPTARSRRGERGVTFAMARDAAWRAGAPTGVRVRDLYRDEALDPPPWCSSSTRARC